MVDSKYFSSTIPIPVHGGKFIQAVYTNDPAEVHRVIDMFQQWLVEEDVKFVGLDMEYSKDHQKLAVMQIAMRDHVLLFHFSRFGSVFLFLIGCYCTPRSIN